MSSPGQVCAWLATSIGLPQYQYRFREAAVSGPVLMSLTDEDLTTTLGIRHPLHRRKILLGLDLMSCEAEVGAYCSGCGPLPPPSPPPFPHPAIPLAPPTPRPRL